MRPQDVPETEYVIFGSNLLKEANRMWDALHTDANIDALEEFDELSKEDAMEEFDKEVEIYGIDYDGNETLLQDIEDFDAYEMFGIETD